MNKLTAKRCREQFEEWLKSTGQNPPYATKRGYWEIWKASREALEIALPILEQQERGEGEWVEWAGGEQPVNGDVMVETKWSDGAVTRGDARNWRWKRTLLSDINLIAYRIIPERATNQNGEQ